MRSWNDDFQLRVVRIGIALYAAIVAGAIVVSMLTGG